MNVSPIALQKSGCFFAGSDKAPVAETPFDAVPRPRRAAGSRVLSRSFKDSVRRTGSVSGAAEVCSPHACVLGFPETAKFDDISGMIQHLTAKERFSQVSPLPIHKFTDRVGKGR